MRNILFLAFWYPHKYNRQFCVFVQEHARAIHVSGYNIRVLAVHLLNSKKILHKYEEVETDSFGFEVRHLYIESYFYRWININPWHCFKIVEKYFRLNFADFKPEIIHSNIVGVCAIIGMKLAEKYKLKHVITEHWTRVDQYMNNNKLSFLGKRAYNSAGAITVVSDFLGNIVSKHVKDTEKIKKVANVIDSEVFNYKNKDKNDDSLILTFIGHLRLPKLPMLIVKSLQEYVTDNKRSVTLYIYGEGELKKDIKNLIPDLNYTIVLRGLQPKTELAQTLQMSDFYLHGSSYETFCVAIAEALSTGTPVLASNNTAIPELINYENGLLVEDTIKSWKEGLEKVVSTPFNHLTISKSVSKFSYNAVGKDFKKVYEDLNAVTF